MQDFKMSAEQIARLVELSEYSYQNNHGGWVGLEACVEASRKNAVNQQYFRDLFMPLMKAKAIIDGDDETLIHLEYHADYEIYKWVNRVDLVSLV